MQHDKSKSSTHYVGRFAPSPTGPLHHGSLLTALVSFLDAKSHEGQWLVRIEDVDISRCREAYNEIILNQLQDFQLTWEGSLLYQSHRSEIYKQYADQLISESKAYYCDCPRKRITALGGIYDQHCLSRALSESESTAIRFRTQSGQTTCEDLIQPPLSQEVKNEIGDFVIKRRDQLFAYQLAVVVDDALQGVTHVVRGVDLIDNTPRQIQLYQALKFELPVYAHNPILVNQAQQKLSKQTYAQAVSSQAAKNTMIDLLGLLKQPTPRYYQDMSLANVLAEAAERWSLSPLKGIEKIPSPF